MEIISYNDAAIGSRNRSLWLSLKQILGSRSTRKDENGLPFVDGDAVKNAAYSVRTCLIVGFKNIKKLVRFAWIIPAVAVIALIPSTVSKIMDRVERNSLAGTVTFQSDNGEDLAYMESLMSDFAMGQDISFDEFGFVISESGSASVSKFVNEPVTFQTYTVKSGDTISGITYRFGLSNISTLIAVNDIENVRALRAGQKLTVPSIDGLFHKVQSGDTIQSIAEKYGCSVTDILDVNDFTTDVIQTGDSIFVPGARMEANALKKAMGEVFACPISAQYRITSYFGNRADPFTGVASNHTGIDMACPTGTQVKSALSGTVSFAGYNSLYGYYVIISHYNGYQTLYGHMSKIIAKKGQVVNQGTVIGLVGSTGYSTGPHLHFTVYKDGKQIDPLSVLK